MKVVSRRLRLTRRGAVFLALTVAVGYASIHKGNNLLFLVFATLAALLVVSLLLSIATVRRLEIRRTLPDDVCSHETFAYTLHIENTKRILPTFCVKVEDSLVLPDRPTLTEPATLLVPIIAAGDRIRHDVAAVAYQRGWVTLPKISITGEFPPGLVSYRETLARESKLLVAPRRGYLDPRALRSLGFHADALTTLVGARGSDVFAGVREYRPGDDPRWIHWRLSARFPKRTLVRELEDERYPSATVLLDTYIPQPESPRRLSRLERAVSFAGAFVDALLQDGRQVRFVAYVPQLVDLALAPGTADVADLRLALATLRPTHEHTVDALLATAGPQRDGTQFVLRIGDEAALPENTPEAVVEIHADHMRSLMHYGRELSR